MANLRPAMGGLLAGIRLGPAIRWESWVSCKLALLIACLCHALLAQATLHGAAVGEAAALFLTFCLIAAFGYAANSYSDVAEDDRAGKSNPFSTLPARRALLFVALIGIAAAAACAALSIYYWRFAITALLALGFGLAGAYSLHPIRLKERGVLGVIASTLAQHTVPAVTIFTAANAWGAISICLTVMTSFIGLRYILVHQVWDEHADRRSQVETVATRYGGAVVTRTITRVLFPLEIASLIACVATMAMSYPLILIAAGWYALSIAFFSRFSDLGRQAYQPFGYMTFAGFYFFYLPLTLAIHLAIREPMFLPILLFVLLWTWQRLEAEIHVVKTIARGLKRRRKARRAS